MMSLARTNHVDDNDDEDDLKNHIIDQDFDPWSEFRASIAVITQSRSRGDDSLQSLFTRLSSISTRSRSSKALNADPICTSIACVALDDSDEKQSSEFPEGQVDVSNHCSQENDIVSEVDNATSENSRSVIFSKLSPGEQRDIRSWNVRLSRDKVFSRYYCPEQWEQSEMKTIQKFLDLENNDASRFSNEIIRNIFRSGDHDPKSVLLKRGPVLFNRGEEREMLIFTHGFLLSRVKFDAPFDILFNANSEKLKDRFITMDDETEMHETIDLESVTKTLALKYEERWNWGLLGRKIKQTMVGPETERNVECAYSYSDVAKVECIDVCHSEATSVYLNSLWAELVLAIFIEKREEPLIIICSNPEHRTAWLDAFSICCVNSAHLQANNGLKDAKHIRSQPGWQHRIIRATLFSLVCTNDVRELGVQLANPSRTIHIDDQDEYRGCTALHYAAILGHLDCAKMLLRHKANVNLEDNDLKTPLDHAVLSEYSAMINLLNENGGKEHSSKILFESAIEEQKRVKGEAASKNSGQTLFQKIQGSSSALAQGMSALRERGDRLASVGDEAVNIHSDAYDYAQIAKQMKEKTKAKSKLFGLI